MLCEVELRRREDHACRSSRRSPASAHDVGCSWSPRPLSHSYPDECALERGRSGHTKPQVLISCFVGARHGGDATRLRDRFDFAGRAAFRVRGAPVVCSRCSHAALRSCAAHLEASEYRVRAMVRLPELRTVCSSWLSVIQLFRRCRALRSTASLSIAVQARQSKPSKL